MDQLKSARYNNSVNKYESSKYDKNKNNKTIDSINTYYNLSHRDEINPQYSDEMRIIMQHIKSIENNHDFIIAKMNKMETTLSDIHIDYNIKHKLQSFDNNFKMIMDKLNSLTQYLCKNDSDSSEHSDSYEFCKNRRDKRYEERKNINSVKALNINSADDCDICSKNIKPLNTFVDQLQQIETNKNNDNAIIMLLKKIDTYDKTFKITKSGAIQKQEQKDSDDEYDASDSIYPDDDINESNISEIEKIDNFVELDKIPANIYDLIELGKKYANILKEKKCQIDTDPSETNPSETNPSETPSKMTHADKSLTSIFSGLKTGDIKNKSTQNEKYELYEINNKKYSINLEIISKLERPLLRLSKMIGLESVKNNIFEMITYYLQGFEKTNNNMLHSVIEGQPGVGKTKLGKILAQIYCNLGIIPSDKFKYVKSTDLIGEHVGSTRIMTQRVIDESDGGVLFIDEAYGLTTGGDKDPYGKECLDTLNFNLSENKKKMIVIIAGYPDQLDKYFFSYNPGLARRFPFRFKINGYTPSELKDIFIYKLKKDKWNLDKSVSMNDLDDFFKKYKTDFLNYGGDVENLFKCCQFVHSNRVLGKHPKLRKRLTYTDIKSGLDNFRKNKKTDANDFKSSYASMYT